MKVSVLERFALYLLLSSFRKYNGHSCKIRKTESIRLKIPWKLSSRKTYIKHCYVYSPLSEDKGYWKGELYCAFSSPEFSLLKFAGRIQYSPWSSQQEFIVYKETVYYDLSPDVNHNGDNWLKEHQKHLFFIGGKPDKQN